MCAIGKINLNKNEIFNWTGSTDDAQTLHPKLLNYASMRNQSVQNHNQTPASIDSISTPSDSESMIDRIKRRSYYCRFNEKKPKRTSSIIGSAAQREYYREQASKSKLRSSDYLPSVELDGFQESDGSLNRGVSKSPIHMNPASTSSIHLRSRSNTPICYSMIDDSEKSTAQPHYHYLRQKSQTPSSVKCSFENNDAPQVKSSEYLNLRSTITSPPAKYYSITSQNGNRPSARSSAYDSLSPSIYG